MSRAFCLHIYTNRSGYDAHNRLRTEDDNQTNDAVYHVLLTKLSFLFVVSATDELNESKHKHYECRKRDKRDDWVKHFYLHLCDEIHIGKHSKNPPFGGFSAVY